jgi:hypothetical protein
MDVQLHVTIQHYLSLTRWVGRSRYHHSYVLLMVIFTARQHNHTCICPVHAFKMPYLHGALSFNLLMHAFCCTHTTNCRGITSSLRWVHLVYVFHESCACYPGSALHT